MKRIVMMLSAVLFMFIWGFQSKAADLRMAYVDIEKVFDDYKITKDYKADLEKKQKDKEKLLLSKRGTIEKSIEDFNKQKFMMNEDKIKEREQQLRGDMQNFQKEVESASLELSVKGREFTKKVLDDIYGVVKRVAQKEKYTQVFEKRSLLFGGEDITDKVVKELNKK